MFSKKTLLAAGAIFLIVLNVVVFSFNYLRRPSFKSAAVYTLFFIIGPVENAFSSLASGMANTWDHYIFLSGASEENDELKRRLAVAGRKLHECREEIKLYHRVKPFADLISATPSLKLLTASIVAKDPSPWYRAVMINRGSKHGVRAGLPVIVPEGLVGRVTAVSYAYAKVVLVVDPNSSVDALVERTRSRGIVTGNSGRECRFDYALRQSDISLGDMVISSGFGGVYPKGIRIGRVTSLVRRNSGLFQEIVITPGVDLQRLEEVMVVLNPQVSTMLPK
ncbi:MAG: rod shape-determining protein MreC [Deltaproteobacteria bacterium]|nr:rod shape-determining protein MreC [Deltaproteobacteria bacterium]